MPTGSPRFDPSPSTSAPCSRATSAVPSVEPSSTTRTSASGSSACRSSSTAGRFSSSFQAGMKTTVSFIAPLLVGCGSGRDRLLARRAVLERTAPSRQQLVNAGGADDRLVRQGKRDRMEDERPRLGAAHPAVERDQLLERAPLLQL